MVCRFQLPLGIAQRDLAAADVGDVLDEAGGVERAAVGVAFADGDGT